METSSIGNQPGSGNVSPGQQSAPYRNNEGADAFDAAYQQRRNLRVATLVLASVLFFFLGYVIGRREEERSRKGLADHLTRQLQDWFGQSGRALGDLKDPLQQGIRTSGEAIQQGIRSSSETIGDLWSKAATSKTAAKLMKAAGKKQPKFLGIF